MCGAARYPRTVVQAAALPRGGAALGSQRGMTRASAHKVDVSGTARVGVFVCHCGINIAGTVDVEAVKRTRGLPYVVYVGRNLFTCSQDTPDIREVIAARPERIVVASCSPRTTAALPGDDSRGGASPYLLSWPTFDQCSWVHAAPASHSRAQDLVRMAVSRAVNNRPLRPAAPRN